METKYASVWQRAWGGLIDSVILLAIILGIIFILYLFGHVADKEKMEELLSVLSFFISPIYFAVCVKNWNGTPGMRSAGMQMKNLAGNQPGIFRIILWWLAHIITQFTFWIGYLIIFFTKKKQNLHDLITGIVFVSTKESESK